MANIHELAPRPNPEVMREALWSLFRETRNGLIELTWTSSTGELNRARLFGTDQIEELVEFAADLNQKPSTNIYFSAGLRRAETNRYRRASDEDVCAVAALKVDCDTSGCLERALATCERIGIRPSLAFFSGKYPNLRGSLWWVLEEPATDLARVRMLDVALMRLFGSDPAVVNSSRVMRLPGCVAWPFKQGRQIEMTGVHDVPIRPVPYTLDEIESTLRRANASHSTTPDVNVVDFSQASRSLEIESLIQQSAEPNEWHKAMVLATAHLTGRGCPPDVTIDVLAPRVTMPGYQEAQTRAELAIMIKGAVAKGWAPTPPEIPDLPDNPFLTIDAMLARPPPDYLVDGYLTEGGMSVLWGASHAFKSFIALDLALSIAYGGDWHGRNIGEARPTLYLCAEGQYGFGVRGLVWRTHRAKDRPCAGFHVLPLPVNFLEPAMVGKLLEAVEKHQIAANFVVIDTLARNFGIGDEGKTPDMNRFIAGVDTLRAKMNAHVMVIHHTGKDETKGERGSYALRGAVDTSLKLERDGKSERIILSHVKQKDGKEQDDLALRVVTGEAVHPLTGEVVTSLLPMLDDALSPRTRAHKLTPNQQRALALLEAGGGDLATLTARSGGDKSNLRRTLLNLVHLGMVRVSKEGVFVCVVTSKGELNP